MAVVDINLPRSWQDLSQRQLQYLLMSIVTAQSSTEAESCWQKAAVWCLTHWAGISLVCPYGHGGYIVRIAGNEGYISAECLASAISELRWIREVPKSPVRLDRIRRGRARFSPKLAGMPFELYLSTENLWLGYAATEDERLLLAIANNLYAPSRPWFSSVAPTRAELLGVWYWWASAKRLLQSMYPDFLSSSGTDAAAPTPDSVRRSADAQIRALTKGDVTKERDILDMDVHRALTELDALAREFKDIEKRYGKL